MSRIGSRTGGGQQPQTAFGRLLLERSITSADLARMVNLTPAAVKKWRGGHAVPSAKVLAVIAHALGIERTKTKTAPQRVAAMMLRRVGKRTT